jgi:ABC-type transporter MlaC component
MGLKSIVTTLILCAAPVALAQGARPTPKALTEQVVATFRALNDPSVPPAQRHSPAQLRALDAFFDFDALSAASFQSHKRALKPRQLAELQQTFRSLLTVLTHHSGEQLAQGDVAIGTPRQVQQNCVVEFAVSRPDEDLTSNVALTWQRRPNGWQVVDVAFDGASVTKDYENQFGRILKKDGAEVLVTKLKERLARVSSEQK